MALKVKEIKSPGLPKESTKGFKIVGDQDDTLMFFHWTEDDQPGTDYKTVLKVLPDRMEAIGLEKETDAVLGEVIGMFGAGS